MHVAGIRLGALEIELLPASVPKLARPYQEEEAQFQCDADDFATRVALDRTQQFSETPGIDDARSMANDGWLEEAAQALCEIALDVSQAYRMTEHAAAPLLGAMRRVTQTLELDLLQHAEKLVRANVRDRPSAEFREHMALEDSGRIVQRVSSDPPFGDRHLEAL